MGIYDWNILIYVHIYLLKEIDRKLEMRFACFLVMFSFIFFVLETKTSVVIIVVATVGECCCTCCAVTTWAKTVDKCETCLDAYPADSYCPAGGFTTTTSTTTSTTMSTTTKRSTIGTTSSTTTSFTTLPQSEPSAYEERPPLRGDFKNEEH